MVTLLYGIEIGEAIQKLVIFLFGAWVGIVFYRAYLRVKSKEQQECLDKSWHAIEDRLEQESKNNSVFEIQSISEQIIVAVENEDYEEAARLRDKLKEK